MILPTQFVKSQNFYLHICVKYRNFADEIRKEDRFGCLQPLKNNAKTRVHLPIDDNKAIGERNAKDIQNSLFRKCEIGCFAL